MNIIEHTPDDVANAWPKAAHNERVVSFVLRCYGVMTVEGKPLFSDIQIKLIEWHFLRAERDCRTLDTSEGQDSCFFATHFYNGILAGDAANDVEAFIRYGADIKQTKAIQEGYNRSAIEGECAHTLWLFREHLRDRHSKEDALANIPLDFIQRCHEQGYTRFFEILGDEIRKARTKPNSFTRSYPAWIRRAWVPLCLWQYRSAKEGWDSIVRRAALANGMTKEVEAIDNKVSEWSSFERAWRSVRSR